MLIDRFSEKFEQEVLRCFTIFPVLRPDKTFYAYGKNFIANGIGYTDVSNQELAGIALEAMKELIADITYHDNSWHSAGVKGDFFECIFKAVKEIWK